MQELTHWINGKHVKGTSGRFADVYNPATGEVQAKVPLASRSELDAAVADAARAQAAWGATNPQRRGRVMMAMVGLINRDMDKLAEALSREHGKTLPDARGDVQRGLEVIEYCINAAQMLKGEFTDSAGPGIDMYSMRQALGVTAGITPFNFPAMIPLWFLPFAIACGNSFILKPSERDPRTSARILELIDGIEEIPAGVVNLVHGAHESVNGLLDHPEIDAISFVGQASTALYVMERGTRSGKRVQALGGAKNSMVVMDDADLGDAVPAMMQSAFGNAGQRCLAGSVAVVVGDEARRSEVRSALAEAARDLPTGPGTDESVICPPMVARDARDRVSDAVDRALAEGAEMVVDGRERTNEAGALMGPTVVAAADRESELAREELFGPVLALLEVDDLGEALEFVNSSRYGNASVIFTQSGAAVRRYRAEVEAGMIGVNVGVPAPVAWFPFAGWKDSMVGDLHANGMDAIEFYTRKKVMTTRW